MWSRVAAIAEKGSEEIDARIQTLEKEWDIERYLGVNMSTLALAGIATSVVTKKKRWLLLPATVLAFFMQHAIQGWCPPLPLLRKLGIRTSKEIELEKYALKFVRGDFKNIREISASELSELKRALAV